MTNIDIFCGLLGSGKTSLIKQMLITAYRGRRTAIIENEIGAVNLDAQELRQAHISVKELTSGCICCTVAGNFVQALELLIAQENPEYIIIEPSGVADLSGIINACRGQNLAAVNRVVMVINAKKIAKLLTIIGEFFRDQVRLMDWVYLNFTETMTPEEIDHAKALLLDINPRLRFVQTPLADITRDTFPLTNIPLSDHATGISTDTSHLSFSNASGGSVQNPSVQSTWSYRFTGVFRRDAILLLKDFLKGPAVRKLWRIKGYLQLEDGVLCKIDYTFGEWFFEERNLDSVSADSVNLLIFIGENLPVVWLEQKMKAYEKYRV